MAASTAGSDSSSLRQGRTTVTRPSVSGTRQNPWRGRGSCGNSGCCECVGGAVCWVCVCVGAWVVSLVLGGEYVVVGGEYVVVGAWCVVVGGEYVVVGGWGGVVVGGEYVVVGGEYVVVGGWDGVVGGV